MDFSLTEDQTLLVDVVRDLLRKRESRRDDYLRAIYEEQSFPEELWQDMGEIGILGALISLRMSRMKCAICST